MPTANVNGIGICYETAGSGRPILCLHGLAGDRRHLRWLAEALSPGCQLIMFDQRGSGASDCWVGDYTTELLANDAAGLLRVLGVDKASVVGLSMGGMVAQKLAVSFARLLDRVVIGCSTAGGSLSVPCAVGSAEQIAEFYRLSLPERVERALASEFGAKFPKDELVVQRLRDELNIDDKRIGLLQRRAIAFNNHDGSQELPHLDLECLVLTGDDDHVVPWRNSEILARLIPHSQLAVISGCGHRFWEENPAIASKIIREFLLSD